AADTGAQLIEGPDRAPGIGGQLADHPVRLVDDVERMNRRVVAESIEKGIQDAIGERRRFERAPAMLIIKPRKIDEHQTQANIRSRRDVEGGTHVLVELFGDAEQLAVTAPLDAAAAIR